MTTAQLKRTTGGIFLSVLCVVVLAVAIKLAMAMSSLHDDTPIESVRPLLPQPSPLRLPADVIQLQVDALRSNSAVYPDAGVEIAYLFASREAKAAIGSLDQFAMLFHGPVYRDLLNHQAAWFGQISFTNEYAHAPVIIRGESNQEAGYVFVLSRETEGSFRDCWLTDRIIRVH